MEVSKYFGIVFFGNLNSYNKLTVKKLGVYVWFLPFDLHSSLIKLLSFKTSV